MRILFADTFYWAAMLNPRDQWHQDVRRVNQSLGSVQIVTTDEVLTELLNFFSEFQPVVKQGVAERVNALLQNPMTQVIAQSHTTFRAGLELYGQRTDKGFSLTDCISMQTMKALDIQEVLTHDHHFTQEGFIILFP